ncbi:alpha/beta hydrolase family protein [Pseudoduganella flava]|uniref:Alpha/beta fold hydrolase n=2 Tax=Pseudoduganella flava TaxID=871742 RepID=A0A562PJF8_9BURK|nr:alpha/beta fold hydrolase [Pseudoduganella flava]TWI44463.1 alpha/beta hydrolase family protein [Pseudoduganella flava]
MVVRILLAIMAVQVAAALAIWYAAAAWVPLDLALLLAVLAVVLVRLAINANNFWMARRYGCTVPDEHRLAPLERLCLFCAEFRASMVTSSWTMLRHKPAPYFAAQPRALPVLLVHGFGANGGFWTPLRALLRREGISHDTVDLEPLGAPIDDYVEHVERAIGRLRAATGAPRIVLVGHSMGGLVVRAWLRRHGTAGVARIVTVGSPHHGTGLAALGIGANVRQMRLDSPWLAQLDKDDAPHRALITSIWSWHDNIIAPQTSSRLDGAKNIAFAGIGHVALGSDPRVLCRVLDEILTAGALTSAPRPATII